MIGEQDIRIYSYSNGNMIKCNARIKGLKKPIHKCNSTIQAILFINILRDSGRWKDKQFIIVDYTNKQGGQLAMIY